MSKYIMANQNKRKEAQNKFEKDFFKLMNNSVNSVPKSWER